jgi:hypothetical protein
MRFHETPTKSGLASMVTREILVQGVYLSAPDETLAEMGGGYHPRLFFV